MSTIDRYADLQAVVDDAFRRGAEAMREAAAQACDQIGRDWQADGMSQKRFAAEYLAGWIRDSIRTPEPK